MTIAQPTIAVQEILNAKWGMMKNLIVLTRCAEVVRQMTQPKLKVARKLFRSEKRVMILSFLTAGEIFASQLRPVMRMWNALLKLLYMSVG